jgi:hypothetical protein
MIIIRLFLRLDAHIIRYYYPSMYLRWNSNVQSFLCTGIIIWERARLFVFEWSQIKNDIMVIVSSFANNHLSMIFKNFLQSFYIHKQFVNIILRYLFAKILAITIWSFLRWEHTNTKSQVCFHNMILAPTNDFTMMLRSFVNANFRCVFIKCLKIILRSFLRWDANMLPRHECK